MQSKSGRFTLGEGSFGNGKVFGKVSCLSRAALPETFEAFVGLRAQATLHMRNALGWGKINVCFDVSQASRTIQGMQASRCIVRIHSPEGYCMSYVRRWYANIVCVCLSLRHLGMIPNSRCSVLKRSAFRHARFQSTNLNFYQNRQLELYAAKEAQRLSLRQLVHDSC